MSYYPRVERETVLLFDAPNGNWRAWSTVPRDIRRLEKTGHVFYREYDNDGRVITIEALLDSGQVRLYKGGG